MWAPPPPEFLHLVASGRPATARDVAAAAAERLTTAGVPPAVAAAAAAGRADLLPPPGGGAAAASANPAADPYGYPILRYDANEILHRAAVETARMAGAAPPPPPGRYTYADPRVGPRVGPGLRALGIAVPPPWLSNVKEMHKVGSCLVIGCCFGKL